MLALKDESVVQAFSSQAAHMQNTYLSAQFHRLAERRGKKRAIVAVAHSILVIAYYLIKRKEPYRELGGNYFDQHNVEATRQHLVKRLERLGYQVTLSQVDSHAA
jgi:transposase